MVCFANFYEACRRGGVVGVLVWVVLLREGEELAFYFCGAGGLGELEGFVVCGRAIGAVVCSRVEE